MKRIQSFLLLFLILISATISQADVIYLKNGQKIEGVIRTQNNNTVEVQTPGGVFSYDRTEIDRIDQGTDTGNRMAEARAAEQQGHYLESINLYSDAVQKASASDKNALISQLGKTIQSYIKDLDNHDPLNQGLQDIQDIQTIKQKISDPHLLSLLQNAKIQLDQKTAQAHFDEGQRQVLRRNYEEAIRHYHLVLDNYPESPLSKNLRERITDLYLEWGENEFKRSSRNNEVARQAFLKALELDTENARALYALGSMAFEEENYKEALDYLSKVSLSALASRDVRNVRNMVSRAERALLPTPTPRPVPVYVPEPTPVPQLSTTQKISGWFSHAWQSIKQFGKGLAKGSLPNNMMPELLNILKILVTAIVALAVLWYIPMKVVLRDLPNRRVIYYNWRKIVNYTGLIGMILYFIDRFYREEPRKRCPACNRAIDNYELFENFDFGICPFCEARIKPPFTLPEVIQNQALVLSRSRSMANGNIDEAQREMMLNFLFLLMIFGRKIRASDIHIEPEEGKMLIRYRVDGVITESLTIEGGLNPLLVSCLKVICNLNIAEKRLPQDGHFQRVILNEEVNVRVSTIPTRLGEKVVMRLLDKQIAKAPLDRLGLRTEALEQYRNAISSSHGLILATGPTGSGKTTLQYASLQYLNDGSKNIITVEDPIEYELEGINQVQHNTKTGLTFATALRSILRQDPDVIMVGEIRDLETGQIAVNAALTGHLVFSTLHTIDTSTALSRLIDIGVDVKLLSTSILGIVAQRLVRKLCPHCKKQSTASSRELKVLGSDGRMLEGQPICRPRGCRECSNTGYIGRTGIYEMLIPNREIRGLIEKNAPSLELRDYARAVGMKTLREEGILKVLGGVTSLEEVLRVTTEDSKIEADEEFPSNSSYPNDTADR